METNEILIYDTAQTALENNITEISQTQRTNMARFHLCKVPKTGRS
jgi:hypothetical protein